jgi:uncharacterized protein (DUF433 family)
MHSSLRHGVKCSEQNVDSNPHGAIRPIISIMNYQNYITIEPNKRGGKPCVRGLRITVYEVLEYLASEMTEAEILDDFPDLTRADLKACIAYAADRERRFMTAPSA